jgi:L-seryl-tRNA(Ser) seleniumtransferase
MSFTKEPNRRSFMKMLAASPLLAQIAAQGLYVKSATAMGLNPNSNVYSRLGVKTVINCRGTWTYLSGSLQFPEALAAQAEAGKHFVNMVELQQAVGRRLAELTGAESGLITSGAAGAMAAATTACMAGSDPAKIWQLPDTTGLKHEVIMVGGRSAFDSAISLAGAKLVLVQGPDDLANEINENTAMIYTTDLKEKLEKEAGIAKAHNVPMLLDDAAGIPPIDNIKLYAKMKLDLYTFSGGKGLRGPQCSGVLLGRKDLIDAALRNSCPYEGAVCRPMKVGKEEVIALLTAIETWLHTDSKKLYDEWNARVERIAKLVETVPGVQTEIYIPEDGNRYPTLRVSWDQDAWGYSIKDCVTALRDGDPVIEVLGIDNPSLVSAVHEGVDKPKPNPKEPKKHNHIELVSMTIQPGEEMIVGDRLRSILGAARKGKAA